MSAYHFVDSDHCRPLGSMSRIEYELAIRQQPERAKVCTSKEKERRPIDPPPIIQLKITDDRQDPLHNYLQSPHLFVCVDLCPVNEGTSLPGGITNALAGTSVSSLYRLKDIDNSDGGFFVFGDLSVKIEGHFRLRFYLFEVQKGEVCYLQSITSAPFSVWSAKLFPGMLDSTFLSRSFSDQGVRIRIRKEHRIKMKRPTQRGQLSPESHAQYAMQDQRPPTSQISPQYPPVSSQAQVYDNRPSSDYHYPGAPVRVHGSRHVEYHPYPRPPQQYAPNYYDRQPYPEMSPMPPSYPAPSPYGNIHPGSHVPQEYAMPQSYGRMQHGHPQSREPYYPQDNRVGGHAPISAHPHWTYPERPQNAYLDSQARPYSADPRRQNPYASDSSRSGTYVDSRPPSSHNGHPPQQYHQPPPPQYRRPEHSPREQRYRDPQSASHELPRSEVPQAPQRPQLAHTRREARHNINAILSEEGKRPSPGPGSRPGSDITSLGSLGERSPPVRMDAQHQEIITLPPLRRGSTTAKADSESGEGQGRSNSNLWKLVDAATDRK